MEEKIIQIQLQQVLTDIEDAIQQVRNDQQLNLMEMNTRVKELCERVVNIRTQNPQLIGQNILTIISRLEELQTEVEYFKDRMTKELSQNK